jgi:hypothetical protein
MSTASVKHVGPDGVNNITIQAGRVDLREVPTADHRTALHPLYENLRSGCGI